jgi:hypothetical protein
MGIDTSGITKIALQIRKKNISWGCGQAITILRALTFQIWKVIQKPATSAAWFKQRILFFSGNRDPSGWAST